MHRVHIRTYGCQMNERDSEGVAALLRAKGYVIQADEAGADIVLINTCSIRGLAEEKAIGKADHLLRARREGGSDERRSGERIAAEDEKFFSCHAEK
jgi:tRNA-2-methylthio-N6-dimethylallyladenosine synthase